MSLIIVGIICAWVGFTVGFLAGAVWNAIFRDAPKAPETEQPKRPSLSVIHGGLQ